ncbi:MAG TPA: hypothetical protein ENJ79_11930 [Gammaproteobacteria bacterium]|nr:hypothetical protein [Gammaproteobacteria bacterium]
MNLLDKDALLRNRGHIHEPVPGYWYVNTLGQLQQVRLVLHRGREGMTRVVIEDISGCRRSMALGDWYKAGLTLHSPGIERRRARLRQDPG